MIARYMDLETEKTMRVELYILFTGLLLFFLVVVFIHFRSRYRRALIQKGWDIQPASSYTIAVDRHPMQRSPNKEMTLYASSLRHANRIGKAWVAEHPSGQARIIKGVYVWEGEQSKKLR